MKPRTWILRAAGAIGMVALVWIGVRAWESKVTIARHLPDLPALATWPPEAQERILAADRNARNLWRARHGLAGLARLYQANGFFDEALACHEGLRVVEPRNAQWYHLSAVILAGLGRLEEAGPLFSHAAELAPDYLPAQVRTADVMWKTNRRDDAQRMYADVLTRFGEQPYALLGLARAAIARDEWGRAEALLQRALVAETDFFGALTLLATVHEHFGRKEEAARIAARVKDRRFAEMRDPWADDLIADCYDPHYLSVAATAAVYRRDLATAKWCLERAASLARDPTSYFRQLGQFGYITRNYAEAGNYLAQAVALTPTSAESWTVWVNVLLAAGNRPEAYRVLRDGLAHCPESGALHYIHGHMLSEDGQLARAIEVLRVAKRFRSTQADVYLDLANAYFQVGDVEAGIAEMKEALAVEPDHPVALAVLAQIAIDRGHEKEAREWLERIRAQLKIGAAEREHITSAFREKFRHEP